MLVKLLQHQTHTIQQTTHIPTPASREALPTKNPRLFLRPQRVLELLEVRHPLLRKPRVHDVGLVEHEDHRQLRLVEDRAGVEHVRHECRGGCRAGRVDDVRDYRRETAREALQKDRAAGGPNEDFYLAGGVDEEMGWGFAFRFGVGSGAFLEETNDLVDFGGEEVEGGEDAAVGAEVVLPHDFLVGDAVANVDVAFEGDG